MLPLVIATRNRHKTREFAELLGTAFTISDLADAQDLPAVEETGQTFEENAVLKALAASSALPGLVVADDSGLEVDALGGAPGVRSARYAGENASDADNVSKVLCELLDVPAAERSARFRCVLAVARRGEILHVACGSVEGRIIAVPRGAQGFGYDPVFVPDGSDLTFAELGATAKNRISHRAAAVAELRGYLMQMAQD